MKKIFFYALLTLTLFSSCQKEMLEPEFPPVFKWPTGTGEYAPYTIGSTFTYEVTKITLPNTTPVFLDDVTYTVTMDTTIENLKYYKLVSNKPAVGPSPTYFTNFTNGKLTEITYNLNYLGLGFAFVPVVKENTLRTNVPENTIWYENLPFSFLGYDVEIDFEYKLVQKNYSKTILGKVYENTHAVEEKITSVIPPALLAQLPSTVPTSSKFDNFYSKNAGLVQRDISDGTSFKLKEKNIIK